MADGNTETVADRAARFRAGRARIAVIGLGYVGLPLSRALVDGGFTVVGIDIDAPKVAGINAGRSYTRQIDDGVIAEMLGTGRFEATTEASGVAGADAVLICVPTPLTRHREPDLSFVKATGRSIAPHLTPGALVVLESTTFPGTTTDVLKPILETGGLKAGADFHLAYSPEREDPGNIDFQTSRIPKVVGGDGLAALNLALALYGRFVIATVPVSTPATAEAVKLTENIFRAVNIALVNELKVIFGAMGIDVWEVVEAAKTKPFGYMPFYPGPGLGGHCIPIDPFYLTWKAREYDISTRFIELAGEINTGMPRLIVDALRHALDQRFRRGLSGARILVLGIAYKKNVDDTRESPALRLIELLEGQGATCAFHDPWVETIPPTREHAPLAGRRSIELTAEALAGHDAVLIATDHDAVDYRLVVDHAALIVDTRNACARLRLPHDKVVKA